VRLAAGGGALVLGAAYRLIRAPSAPKTWVTACNAVVLALGLLVLANSRPYEGLWFALPVMMVLLVNLVRRKLPIRMALLRSAVLPFLVVMAMGGGAMLAYNHAVTGRWAEMPYAAYAKASDPVPVFLWQRMPPHASPKDEVLRRFQEEGELQYTKARTLRGRAKFAYSALGFFSFLIPATVLFPFLLLPCCSATDRRSSPPRPPWRCCSAWPSRPITSITTLRQRPPPSSPYTARVSDCSADCA
jgi:hypothetical protein